MPDYAVSTAFTAKDKVSPAFRAMSRGADRFGGRAATAFNKASRAGSRFDGIVKGILTAGAIQKGVGALSFGLQEVTRQFVAFDDAIFGAAARFKDIGPDAENFDERLNIIKRSARDAGASTKYNAAQAASGLDFLARAGFSSVEAMGSLVSMINLATATGSDFAEAADYSSDLLGAFGLAADTAAQKIASLNRLNDVLVKTANSANVNLENMFETMKTAGPISKIIGMSLEETAAATAILGNSGIKGTEAATALKNSMLRLADPKIQKMLVANGIAVMDNEGNMRKYSAILSDVGNKISGMGTAKQAAILREVFGMYAIAGAKNLIDNLKGLEAFEQMLINAAGTSERTAARLQQSWGNRLLALGSAATEIGFKILDAFGKDGKDGVQAFTNALRALDVGPIVQGMKAAWAAAVGFYNVLRPFLPLLPYLVGWFVIYKTTLAGLGIAAAVIEFGKFITTIYKLAGAMGILDVILAANPIGLMVGAVAALVVGLVYLERRFGFLSAGVDMLKTAFVSSVAFMKITFLKFASFVFGMWSKIITTVVDGAAKLGSLIGIDTSGLEALSSRIERFREEINLAAQEAPNAKEAEARRIQFRGQLNIAGAPAGSTFEAQTSGAPAIRVDLLGANH